MNSLIDHQGIKLSSLRYVWDDQIIDKLENCSVSDDLNKIVDNVISFIKLNITLMFNGYDE